MIPFHEWCRKYLRLKLTVGQSVLAAVCFDGLQPRELPEKWHEVCTSMFGSLDEIPDLARDRIVLSCGRGSGKSTLSAAASLRRMVEADLSPVGPGDTAAALVIGAGKDGGEDTLNKARALAEGSLFAAAIRRNIIGGFEIQRADGRIVQFKSIAASARGKAGRGKSIIQVIIDESEFVASSDPAKATRDSEIIASVTPRMIEGAKLILASTPWPAESETHRLFRENWGRPQVALCARATTIVMRDHDPFWVKKREAEYLRDPMNAAREYDCERGSAEGCFFEAASVDAAKSSNIVTERYRTCAGIDLAFRSDSSSLVITERQTSVLVVVRTEVDSPRQELVADSHYIESAREAASSVGMQVAEGPSLTGDKEASFVYLRDLLREGLLVLPDNEYLLMQLKSVMVVHQSGGGLRIVLPRKAGSGHCDLVSALVNAAWFDRMKYGPLTGKAMKDTLQPSFVVRRSPLGFTKGSTFR